MKMNFNETNEFKKDLKQLLRKYKSLYEDLEDFKKVISVIPLGNSKHFAVLNVSGEVKIVKARLFCRYLKGSSLRIIYAYHAKTNSIELIEFIELYYKGNKEREDKLRIDDYLKNHQ